MKGEENTETWEAVAVGTATMDKDTRKKLIQFWLKQMKGKEEKKKLDRKMNPEILKLLFSQMGIGVCFPKN